jgi:nicotinate phosphoribosyltransferase
MTTSTLTSFAAPEGRKPPLGRAMIIESLLDTDLYKFTMMQVVLHHFPGAQVEYRFKCRNRNVRSRRTSRRSSGHP